MYDLPAGDIRDEGVAPAEDFELRRCQEMGRVFREGHADEEMVEILR